METINLISVDDLKQITSISENADCAAISPFIHNAQMHYLRELVGDAMYNDMVANKASGTTKYENLIQEYVLYMLGYWSWADFTPFAHIKFQKKGLVKQSAEDSVNAEMDEVVMILKRIESMAVYYTNRLKDYLDNNTSLYPLYRQDNCDDTYTQGGNGIFLKFGNAKYKTNYNPSENRFI